MVRTSKKKRTPRLNRTTAIARVDGMIGLIQRDVRIGIEVEAALETANSIVMSEMQGVQFYGADCYNSVRQSMSLFLALTLAKLFETPNPRQGQTRSSRYNKSDVASIPLLVRLLKQKQCRRALAERARSWTPMLTSMEETNARACEHAVDRAVAAYTRVVRTHGGRKAIAGLKAFRNKALAHTLLGAALKVAPKYSDLFFLMDVARDVATHAQLAILGNNLDLRDVQKEQVRMSKAFWKPALAAAAKGGLPD